MSKSVKDINEIIAEIEDGLLGIGQRAYDLWAGQGRDLKVEAAVRVQRGEATVEEIIAEETEEFHVYEILYFGDGPDQYDLDEVRALAEDTLHPGQELEAYEDGRLVAHFKAAPDGVVWEVEIA